MRIVAIHTRHESFIYTVFERHREIAPNIGVTAVASFRRSLCQQIFASRRFVNGVAIRTNHATQRVGRCSYVRTIESFGMTAQTSIELLLGFQLRERDDRCLTAVRFNMGFAWPMATFAAGFIRRLVVVGYRSEMGVFVKRKPDIGMAGFTNQATDKFVLA